MESKVSDVKQRLMARKARLQKEARDAKPDGAAPPPAPAPASATNAEAPAAAATEPSEGPSPAPDGARDLPQAPAASEPSRAETPTEESEDTDGPTLTPQQSDAPSAGTPTAAGTPGPAAPDAAEERGDALAAPAAALDSPSPVRGRTSCASAFSDDSTLTLETPEPSGLRTATDAASESPWAAVRDELAVERERERERLQEPPGDGARALTPGGDAAVGAVARRVLSLPQDGARPEEEEEVPLDGPRGMWATAAAGPEANDVAAVARDEGAAPVPPVAPDAASALEDPVLKALPETRPPRTGSPADSAAAAAEEESPRGRPEARLIAPSLDAPDDPRPGPSPPAPGPAADADPQQQVRYPAGSVYEGTVHPLSNLRHGHGRLRNHDRSAMYIGEWKDHHKQGQGLMQYPAGRS